MGNRDDSWQRLRAMRSAPTGLAAADPDRRAVYAAALRQAQELADAAVVAGYATKLLMLFYALSQGVRAIAAARLADDAWRVRGHGESIRAATTVLNTEVIPAKSRVRKATRDGFSALQTAENHPPMEEPMTVAEIWRAAPYTPELPAEFAALGSPALTLHEPVHKEIKARRLSEGRIELAVDGLPAETPTSSLADALRCYPTLAGAEPVVDVPTELAEVYDTTGQQVRWLPRTFRLALPLSVGSWIERAAVLSWPLKRGSTSEQAWEDAFERLGPVQVENHPGQRMALPAIGGSDEPGFMSLWWALLLGLSSLVRYEPSMWIAAIDVDRSTLAVPLEQVCETAAWVVPKFLLVALEDGDS